MQSRDLLLIGFNLQGFNKHDMIHMPTLPSLLSGLSPLKLDELDAAYTEAKMPAKGKEAYYLITNDCGWYNRETGCLAQDPNIPHIKYTFNQTEFIGYFKKPKLCIEYLVDEKIIVYPAGKISSITHCYNDLMECEFIVADHRKALEYMTKTLNRYIKYGCVYQPLQNALNAISLIGKINEEIHNHKL